MNDYKALRDAAQKAMDLLWTDRANEAAIEYLKNAADPVITLQLLAELDAARADAARWRYARDLFSIEDVLRAEADRFGTPCEEESRKTDAAIDEAMKGQP